MQKFMINNWIDLKQSLKNIINQSDLHMTKEIPWEGLNKDESSTISEKDKLYNNIKQVLKEYIND